jgi:hypothetical protein
MSASIISITGRLHARLSMPLSDPDRARRMVRDRLIHTGCQSERIRVAQLRAERSVSAGFGVNRCVERAVLWALNEPTNPPPIAA